MDALDALSGYMLIGVFLLIIGLVLLYLFDSSHSEQPKPQAQPKEVQQRPEMAQRVRPCPYCDVQEEASWVAFDAWQREIKQ